MTLKLFLGELLFPWWSHYSLVNNDWGSCFSLVCYAWGSCYFRGVNIYRKPDFGLNVVNRGFIIYLYFDRS